MFGIIIVIVALTPVLAFVALLLRPHRTSPLLGRTHLDAAWAARDDERRPSADIPRDADRRRIAAELRALAQHETS